MFLDKSWIFFSFFLFLFDQEPKLIENIYFERAVWTFFGIIVDVLFDNSLSIAPIGVYMSWNPHKRMYGYSCFNLYHFCSFLYVFCFLCWWLNSVCVYISSGSTQCASCARQHLHCMYAKKSIEWWRRSKTWSGYIKFSEIEIALH